MHERQLSFAIDVAVSCITLLSLAHHERFPIRTQYEARNFLLKIAWYSNPIRY